MLVSADFVVSVVKMERPLGEQQMQLTSCRCDEGLGGRRLARGRNGYAMYGLFLGRWSDLTEVD